MLYPTVHILDLSADQRANIKSYDDLSADAQKIGFATMFEIEVRALADTIAKSKALINQKNINAIINAPVEAKYHRIRVKNGLKNMKKFVDPVYFTKVIVGNFSEFLEDGTYVYYCPKDPSNELFNQ